MTDDFIEETREDVILAGSEYPMTHEERYLFVKNRKYDKLSEINVGSEEVKSYQERRAFLRNSEAGEFWGVPQDEPEALVTREDYAEF